MNQKELDLCIKLAPKLNEYRGEWQVGDCLWDGKEITYVSDFSLYYFNGIIVYIDGPAPTRIWIPKAIDPLDPGRIARGEKPRGLMGMIRHCIGMEFDGNTAILIQTTGEGYKRIYGLTPTHALLLALDEQWKEKEK